MYADFFYEKMINMGIRVHPAEGAFYMYLDFANFSQKLAAKKIKTDTELCLTLLKDLGISLLPGNAFGINDGYTGNFFLT